mgnify:CR=1 FL=1
MDAESKHAAKLRELGFSHMPSIARSKAEKAKYGPTFSAMPEVTFATDETGQSWKAVGSHDLTSLGFKNTSARVRTVSEQLGLRPKRH